MREWAESVGRITSASGNLQTWAPASTWSRHSCPTVTQENREKQSTLQWTGHRSGRQYLYLYWSWGRISGTITLSHLLFQSAWSARFQGERLGVCAPQGQGCVWLPMYMCVWGNKWDYVDAQELSSLNKLCLVKENMKLLKKNALILLSSTMTPGYAVRVDHMKGPPLCCHVPLITHGKRSGWHSGCAPTRLKETDARTRISRSIYSGLLVSSGHRNIYVHSVFKSNYVRVFIAGRGLNRL